MRLFYAIEFDLFTKRTIAAAADRLRRQVQGGRWTRLENLHLTLVFLGEIEPGQLELFHEVLLQATGSLKLFSLSLCGYGVFGRLDEVLWIGVQDEPLLQKLVTNLHHALRQRQLDCDIRPYNPHVTFARQVRLSAEKLKWQGPALQCPVSAVVLMESARENGRLIYRPLLQVEPGDAGNGSDCRPDQE